MTHFAYAFLITLNLMLLGLVNLPDSVMREPEGDWCRAAEIRKATWAHAQNQRNTPYIASRNHFNPKNEKDTVSW
jgi:hypothetical protein